MQSLIEELEAARTKATSLNQLSAPVRATAEKVRISGLLIERQQIEVTLPDFTDEMSVAEILQKVADRAGMDKARALAAVFEVDWPLVDATRVGATRSVVSTPRPVSLPAEWRPPINGRKRQIG